MNGEKISGLFVGVELFPIGGCLHPPKCFMTFLHYKVSFSTKHFIIGIVDWEIDFAVILPALLH